MKKIGLRTIKTGIAVFLATLAGYYGLVETPVYTVSVCIFSIKNTMKSSISDARSRILGTLLGGLIGYIFALLTHGEIVSTAIGVVFIIHLCNLFKISDSAGIASVTFTAILIGIGQNDPLTYSIFRTIDTLIGLLIALVVNYGVSRHKHLKYISSAFNSVHVDCIDLVSDMVAKNDFSEYPKYEELFDDLKNYYNQLLDEITYVNKDADYTDVKEYFNIFEQLLHHVHGLYLLENNSLDKSNWSEDAIYKYHLDSISQLLSMSLLTELNFDLILDL